MRTDAREEISRVAFGEAMNDGIADIVPRVTVKTLSFDRHGEEVHTPVQISPALAYLLMDELELGVNVPQGEHQRVTVIIDVPAWEAA